MHPHECLQMCDVKEMSRVKTCIGKYKRRNVLANIAKESEIMIQGNTMGIATRTWENESLALVCTALKNLFTYMGLHIYSHTYITLVFQMCLTF